MAIRINTTNKITKIYKSKAVEDLEDSYLKSLLKKQYGKDYPISNNMIKVKKMLVLLYRLKNGKLTKDQGLKFVKDYRDFPQKLFESVEKDYAQALKAYHQQTKKV